MNLQPNQLPTELNEANAKNSSALIKILVGLGAVIGFLLATSSYAQTKNDGTFFGKQAKGKWVIGAKAGKIDNNVEGLADADAVGIVVGYEFDKPMIGGGSSSFEIEYLTGDETGLPLDRRYEADVLNMFFTYRSAGTLYYKLKGGLSYSSIDVSGPTGNFNSEDVALAAGIGLGYRFNESGVIELEYSQDAGANDLGTLGLNALVTF